MPLTHPLADSASIRWDALQNAPLVTLNAEAGVRGALDRALSTRRIDASRTHACGHLAAALRMIELGLGIGVLPLDASTPPLSASLIARPLVPETTLTAVLVRRRNRSLRPNADAVWARFAGVVAAAAAPGTTRINAGQTPFVTDHEALLRTS
jgi:DNA-binding transcriptional LysR family regulator